MGKHTAILRKKSSGEKNRERTCILAENLISSCSSRDLPIHTLMNW